MSSSIPLFELAGVCTEVTPAEHSALLLVTLSNVSNKANIGFSVAVGTEALH